MPPPVGVRRWVSNETGDIIGAGLWRRALPGQLFAPRLAPYRA